MATNLPSCFFIQFLEKLLKFLVNFTLLKHVKSQRSYGFLIIKELIFGFQILDLKNHFSASLIYFLNLHLYMRTQSIGEPSTILGHRSVGLYIDMRPSALHSSQSKRAVKFQVKLYALFFKFCKS